MLHTPHEKIEQLRQRSCLIISAEVGVLSSVLHFTERKKDEKRCLEVCMAEALSTQRLNLRLA